MPEKSGFGPVFAGAGFRAILLERLDGGGARA